MQKPPNLIYGIDDKPSLMIIIIMGIQHVCVMFAGMVFPVLIVRQLGGSITEEAGQNFVSMSLVSGGIATILQSLKKGPVGSGYLCPSLGGPSYLDATTIAAITGGLPLVAGMTALAGFLEILFSRLMNKLRFLFPTEVIGLIVAMVGVVIIPIALRNFFGIVNQNTTINYREVIVASITLFVMIGLCIWGKGKLKLYGVLFGLIVGYILSIIMNIIPENDLTRINSADFFSFPGLNLTWTFDFSLIIPFIVATICSSFKTVGDIVTCQKINDVNWKRADMDNVSNGIFADGLGGVIPGILGGYGQSTSSSNIGLTIATGTTSRIIAYSAGTFFIMLAFLPKLAEVFIIMPKPVIGAILVFSICFMLNTGFQMMLSRMLDTRKIFVIGVSLVSGLSVDILPGLYNGVHPWIKPIFSSSLSLATITAITLNFIFRLGIAKQKSLVVTPENFNSNTIFEFMELQGGLWGARKDVITKCTIALNELIEVLVNCKNAKGEILVDIKFDELQLEAKVAYYGESFEFNSEIPNDEEIADAKVGTMKLSGYIVHKSSDRIKMHFRDGRNIIILHFEH